MLRDADSDARSAQAHAFRTDTRDAWLVAEDAWRVAGDEERGDAIRRLLRGRRTPSERMLIDGIADAYWLDAWADAMEENGRTLPRHVDLTTADPMPRGVRRAAQRFATAIELANAVPLEAIIARAATGNVRPIDPHELGYYLTMPAMGHGVSWTDRHPCFDILLPRTETSATPVRGRRWHFWSEISFRFVRPLC